MKIVMVEWDDSHVLSGWVWRKADNKVSSCVSFGLLYKEDNKQVEILTTSGEDTKMDALAIPRGCIKRITTLRVKRNAKFNPLPKQFNQSDNATT